MTGRVEGLETGFYTPSNSVKRDKTASNTKDGAYLWLETCVLCHKEGGKTQWSWKSRMSEWRSVSTGGAEWHFGSLASLATRKDSFFKEENEMWTSQSNFRWRWRTRIENETKNCVTCCQKNQILWPLLSEGHAIVWEYAWQDEIRNLNHCSHFGFAPQQRVNRSFQICILLLQLDNETFCVCYINSGTFLRCGCGSAGERLLPQIVVCNIDRSF